MEKVKITRKQADAIELTRSKGVINQEIVNRYFHNDLIQVNGYLEISNMPLDILIRSLYIGYEVEEQIDSVAIFAEKFGRKFS